MVFIISFIVGIITLIIGFFILKIEPVGSALIGLSVGQQLAWPMPNKQTKTIEIVDVVYQPERCGALNR